MASNLQSQSGNKYSRIVFNDNPVGTATGGNWNMMPFWRGNSPDGMACNVTFFNWTWIPSEKYTGNGSDAPASWSTNVEADARCERSSKVGLFWGTNLSYIPIGNTTNALYTTFYNKTGNAGLDMSKMYGLGPRQATKHDFCLTFRVDAWNQSSFDPSSVANNWQPTTKTFTLDDYLNGETNGVPNREAYPYIGCIIAKPWLRMGNQSDGSDVTDSTPRVAVKGTYGTSGGSVYIKYPHAGSSAGALAITSVAPQDGVLQRHKVGTSSYMTVEASKVEYAVTPLSADGQWYFGWGFHCHHCRYNGDGSSSTDKYYSPNLPDSETTNTPVYLHPMNVDSAYAGSAIWTSRASATAMPYFHYIAWYKGANIIQLLNSLGLDWAETDAIAANGNPGDTGYHVPEVGADGTPTGFDENDPSKWGTDWNGASDPEGVTDEEGDPTVNDNTGGGQDDPSDPNTPPTNQEGIITNPDDPDLANETISAIGDVSGTTKFVMDLAGVLAVRNYFNATYQPTDAELTANFKGRNPFDYIVSLKLYPFTHTVGTSQNIIIGGVNTQIAHPVLTNGVKILDFGSVTIPAYFGSFLDYAPYTSIRLSVPFCGSIDLDPAIYVGRTVGLKAIVDYNTGAMTAVVLLDNKYQMATLEGVAAIDMPLFGVNQGDYQNAVFDAQYALTMARLNERKAVIGGFKSILSGSGGSSFDEGGEGQSSGGLISGAVSAIAGLAFNMASAGTNLTTARVQTAKAEWDLDHTAPNVGSIGSASAINNFVLELKPKLTITRAKFLEGMDVGMYGRTVGYACLKTCLIGNTRGYTQFADVKFVNSTMNESERNILRGLLTTGIII